MIDKETYDSLALRLEHALSENSCIKWHVCQYNEMLGAACVSDEDAQEMKTTPDAHFESTYRQMVVWFHVEVVYKALMNKLYVARVLVEDAIDPVDIIKQLAAEQIALMLIENEVV